MRQAVGALVGEEAARGLSANVVSRLKRSWDEEYRQWCRRRLDDEWVYLWADGIYSGLRGEHERLCVLVVIGVNARGEKHFLAIEDGVRESTQSWREVLLGMKQRGFTRPAKLAVGDGALGFWAALSEVFPATRTQRCWMHKTGNLLNYLPKSGQAKAKQGLHEIWMAETKAQAERAFDDWLEHATTTSTPRPPPAWLATATNCSRSTTSPLPTGRTFERPTSSSRPSQRSDTAAREPRAASHDQTMLSMIYKMGRCAEKSWRRLRGFRQLAKVIQGVRFNDGIEPHRGQQGRRMNNPPYTRFDNSSIGTRPKPRHRPARPPPPAASGTTGSLRVWRRSVPPSGTTHAVGVLLRLPARCGHPLHEKNPGRMTTAGVPADGTEKHLEEP